jgi:TetR/AcrR family fatty acid metabolism transcriptional regulator
MDVSSDNVLSKRQEILRAAEKIFSLKGRQATISEIALEADVTESTIYHYFENKTDLIFYAAEQRLREGFEELDEQMQGIWDPISKLSKLVWCQLRYHETHPDYARLVLFECRSDPRFYLHEAYQPFRRWARMLPGILDEGVQQGIFRSDLNIAVVRDAIFGLLDLENIQFLAGHLSRPSSTDLNDMMTLILPMITHGDKSPVLKVDKSARILDAAEKIIGEKGFSRATITDIAKAAEVAEGTVYEYFKNKEDLLFSIFSEHFQNHLESLDEIFEIKTPLRKLSRFIRYHFLIFLAQPSFLKIFVLNGLFNLHFYRSEAFGIFKRYLAYVSSIIEEGQRDGSIRQDVNSRLFVNLFAGVFSHVALRWFVVNPGAQINKTEEIDEVVRLLKRAVSVSPIT